MKYMLIMRDTNEAYEASKEVDFEEVIRLDRQYIEDWSLLEDLRILLRTIPAAFGRGAY